MKRNRNESNMQGREAERAEIKSRNSEVQSSKKVKHRAAGISRIKA